MGNEWPTVSLGDLSNITSSKRIFASDYCTSGVPFYRSKEIIEKAKGNSISTELFISIEKFEGIKNKFGAPKANDILLTSVGTLGIPYLVCQNEEFYFKDGNLTWLQTSNSDICPRFVYLWLRSDIAKRAIDEVTIGSTQQALTIVALKSLKLKLPPHPEQKAIAHILGSLDDKIELNRRMNATLEGMAQALFKSWFVDFDPVIDNALVAGNPIPEELAERAEVRSKALADGTANREAARQFPASFQFTEEMGWIPERWEMKKLSDLLEVKYGKAHKKLSDGIIPVYGSGGLMRHADNFLYKGESVLIPRKGTLSNILYLNEAFWTVDTMFYTIPKSQFLLKYLFYHLKSLDFTSMNVGSAVPSMTTKVLNELPILMPTEVVLWSFDSITTSYFDKTEANNRESNTLSNLRDTLLPKLISGELRIPEVEKLTEEALA